MAELGALVKNFLDEPLQYYIRKKDGGIMKGELKSNSYVDIQGMSVGDDIHVWNDRHVAREIFRHPRNSKYIIGYPRQRKELDFMHRGYHPIIVSEWGQEPRTTEKKEEPKAKSDNGYIIIIVIIMMFCLALIITIVFLIGSRGSYTGSGETVEAPPLSHAEPIFI